MFAACLVAKVPRCLTATGGIHTASVILRCGARPPCLRSPSLRIQMYANDAKTAFRRGALRRKPLTSQGLAAETAFTMGKGLVAGGSILALGGLCYYGAGLSKDVGILENSMLWPQYVKDRVKTTYLYFGATIAATAASAVLVARSPVLMNLMMTNTWIAFGVTIAAVIGSGMLVHSMDYPQGLGAKHLAWLAHAGIIGAVVAPLCLLGGPLLLRAAWYTTGVVGGLSALAVCAPSDRFLYMGAPLAIGFGVVFVSTIASVFVSPVTAIGAGIHSIYMYGGLVLFSGFLLYDTQRIVRTAETHPEYAVRRYDPINQSMSIFSDTLQIFIRIAMLLAGGGGGKRSK